METTVEEIKVAKIKLDGELKSRLVRAKETLEERGVKDASIHTIAIEMLKSVDQTTIDEIVEKLTPISFLVSEGLADPETLQEITKLLQARKKRQKIQKP